MIAKLKDNHQHYIPIIDMAIPKAPTNDTDVYYPGTRGDELDVFIKNRNGSQYIGEVWPVTPTLSTNRPRMRASGGPRRSATLARLSTSQVSGWI